MRVLNANAAGAILIWALVGRAFRVPGWTLTLLVSVLGTAAGLESQPLFAPVFSDHGRTIRGGLHVFAGKRLIDAGEPRRALRHFWTAGRISPRVMAKSWYKAVQALGGALGLTGLFLAYRRARRQVQHPAQRLVVDAEGVRWEAVG